MESSNNIQNIRKIPSFEGMTIIHNHSSIMLPTTYTFQYDPANLHAFSYAFSMDNLTVPLIAIWIIALYGCIYLLAPHIYSRSLSHSQKQEKEAKRNVIKDLILMKEVQGELEKEIEQSLLNITLQGKGT